MVEQIVILDQVTDTQIVINETVTSSRVSGIPLESADTKADISDSTVKRFVEVMADESNGNAYSLYIHNGNFLTQILLA